jgi:hypothetical protein
MQISNMQGKGLRMNVFSDEQHQSAHEDFVRWIDSNYDEGYVINLKSSRGAMIHRASCGHFKHGNKSHSLTAAPKVCFQDRRAYDSWASENREHAQSLRRCPDCM